MSGDPEARGQRRRSRRREAQAELAWKWLLRFIGLATFVYVLLTKGGEAPMPVYVVIGGFIGLPNVLSLQQAFNRASPPSEDET